MDWITKVSLIAMVFFIFSCKKEDPSPGSYWLINDTCASEMIEGAMVREECCDDGKKIINTEFILGTDKVILTCK